MPFKKQIAEVERSIEETRAEISLLRAGVARRRSADEQVKLDKAIAALARLKAERIRLMERQLLFDRNSE